MRASVRQLAIAVLAACIAAVPALADDAASTSSGYSDSTPVVGGLSLVSERWRYRPAPVPATFVENGGLVADNASGALLQSRTGLMTLETEYVPDRKSFINTLRARRGLSFLTLWEGAGRCLFLGVNERGRAGINFVRVREAEPSQEAPSATLALYDELMGKPRATFPEPPRLLQH